MRWFLSKNQPLLLQLFFTNPDRSYYMQEVGRILGGKPGIFQRTLNALVEEGWLKSEYRAHARFFQANTHHPLYPELKKIVAKTADVEGTLKDLLGATSGDKNRLGTASKRAAAFIHSSPALSEMLPVITPTGEYRTFIMQESIANPTWVPALL